MKEITELLQQVITELRGIKEELAWRNEHYESSDDFIKLIEEHQEKPEDITQQVMNQMDEVVGDLADRITEIFGNMPAAGTDKHQTNERN